MIKWKLSVTNSATVKMVMDDVEGEWYYKDDVDEEIDKLHLRIRDLEELKGERKCP